MLKKITKQSLEELEKVMPVVPEWEMATMIGGTGTYSGSSITGGVTYVSEINGQIYEVTSNGEIVRVLPEVVITGTQSNSFDYFTKLGYTFLDTSGSVTGSRDISPLIGGGGASAAPSLINKTVLGQVGFVGYNPNDPSGCMKRCQEMLAKTNTFLNGTKVGMVKINNGEIIGKSSTYQQGVNAINDSLLNGKPVVVGVDYKPGSPNSDGVTDHFIVIAGVSQTQTSGGIQTTYQFFDPTTSQTSYGTSSNNTLTVTSNGIIGTYKHTDGSVHSYSVTDVRINK